MNSENEELASGIRAAEAYERLPEVLESRRSFILKIQARGYRHLGAILAIVGLSLVILSAISFPPAVAGATIEPLRNILAALPLIGGMVFLVGGLISSLWSRRLIEEHHRLQSDFSPQLEA